MIPSKSNRIAVGRFMVTVAPVNIVAWLDFLALGQSRDRHHLLARLEADEPYTLRVATALAYLRNVQADQLAPGGDEHDLIFVRDDQHTDHWSRLFRHAHRDDALSA